LPRVSRGRRARRQGPYFLHTLNGTPATFLPFVGRIVPDGYKVKLELVGSLAEIQKNERVHRRNSKRFGSEGCWTPGYVKVEVKRRGKA
jgi:hypothetical protein